MNIREIRKEDDPAVEAVIRSCLIEFGADHEGTAWTDPDLCRFSEIYQSEGTCYWVAEDTDGTIVAGAGIGRLSGLNDVCELQKMYCLPAFRGTGVSHQLMDTALAYAAGYYRQCYLETLPNMRAAQKFYEKYGFRRIYEPLIQTAHYACDVRYLKHLQTEGSVPPQLWQNNPMTVHDLIPSRTEAEHILMQGLRENPGKWGDHSRNVARSAEAIGSAAGLDGDRCYVSGLLHDIGRRHGNFQLAHIYYGWKDMLKEGYPLIARICLSHSFALQEIRAYGGAFDLREDEIREMDEALLAMQYDDYDRLIQLCDNISGASGIMRMEDRIADIQSRYSNYPDDKRKVTMDLIEYFNRLTGSDIYLLSCNGRTVDHY